MFIRDIRRILICLMVLFSAYAEAGLFGPSNYEECILEKMKGITSDLAARAVIAACRDKFPDKSPPLSSKVWDETLKEVERKYLLSAVQVRNIKNEGVSLYGNSLVVKLYNGNSDVAIQGIIYRYRINDGKRVSDWSNKHKWYFGTGHSNPSFLPYSYTSNTLENLDVKKLPKNFSVSFEIVEARRF